MYAQKASQRDKLSQKEAPLLENTPRNPRKYTKGKDSALDSTPRQGVQLITRVEQGLPPNLISSLSVPFIQPVTQNFIKHAAEKEEVKVELLCLPPILQNSQSEKGLN